MKLNRLNTCEITHAHPHVPDLRGAVDGAGDDVARVSGEKDAVDPDLLGGHEPHWCATVHAYPLVVGCVVQCHVLSGTATIHTWSVSIIR